jgi:hypothetical protein
VRACVCVRARERGDRGRVGGKGGGVRAGGRAGGWEAEAQTHPATLNVF